MNMVQEFQKLGFWRMLRVCCSRCLSLMAGLGGCRIHGIFQDGQYCIPNTVDVEKKKVQKNMLILMLRRNAADLWTEQATNPLLMGPIEVHRQRIRPLSLVAVPGSKDVKVEAILGVFERTAVDE